VILKRKILIADRPQGIETLHNVLGDSVELIAASSIDAAIRALAKPIDLVICGLHFDDSRMFDLLIYAHGNSHTCRIPFLIFRDLELELDRIIFKSLEISAKSLGAAGFVDLFTLKKETGISSADEKFRQIIFSLID
jgi:hypothetical protein